MTRSAIWLPLLIAPMTAGCVDPAERFDDFGRRAAERRPDAQAEDASPGCEPPEPGAINAPALLALETTIGPGKPVLFFGEISTPAVDGRTHVYYEYRALDAKDRRTEVGKALTVGPFPLGPEGEFSVFISEDTLPGEANAILPGVPITSSLTLSGRICGEKSFYCGGVTGNSSSPVIAELSGSFGIELISSIDAVPDRPRYGCDEDDLAAAL